MSVIQFLNFGARPLPQQHATRRLARTSVKDTNLRRFAGTCLVYPNRAVRGVLGICVKVMSSRALSTWCQYEWTSGQSMLNGGSLRLLRHICHSYQKCVSLGGRVCQECNSYGAGI